MTNQSSVALTGANDKGHFRLGISDLYLSTIVPNSYMQQQGLNFNSTFFITNKLEMDLKADYVFEQVNNRVSVSDDPGNVMAPPLYLANSFDIRWMRNHTVRPNGTEWLPGTTDLYFENPYYIAYNYQNTTDRNRITGGPAGAGRLSVQCHADRAVGRRVYAGGGQLRRQPYAVRGELSRTQQQFHAWCEQGPR
jgi:hypothetical protein